MNNNYYKGVVMHLLEPLVVDFALSKYLTQQEAYLFALGNMADFIIMCCL